MDIALTIDDLPSLVFETGVVELETDSEQFDVSAGLIETLIAFDIPAVVFANSARMRRDSPVLRGWASAGFEIGNHTASHLALDARPLAEWKDDVMRCDRFLFDATGTRPRYFRYPYLRYGATAARRDAAARFLRAAGYTTAHASTPVCDWLLAGHYAAAVAAGDLDLASEVAAAYVADILESIRVGRALAQRRVGRNVPQILCSHVSGLAAAHFGTVVRLCAAAACRWVSLEEALADPVYEMVDRRVSARGSSWLLHLTSRRCGVTGSDDWFEQQEARMRRRFDPEFPGRSRR